MSKSLRVLVIINPGASRAEAALPAVSSWFSENSDATIVVAKSKKDRAKGVRPASRPPIPDTNRSGPQTRRASSLMRKLKLFCV